MEHHMLLSRYSLECFSNANEYVIGVIGDLSLCATLYVCVLVVHVRTASDISSIVVCNIVAFSAIEKKTLHIRRMNQ